MVHLRQLFFYFSQKAQGMPKTCKIEQMGLSETVQSLMAEGVSTRAAMTDKLRADYGADLSPATVGRFMAKLRASAHGEAYKTITDHVNKTVPDDLAALEEMEKQALDWSREAGRSIAERAAEAADLIKGELDEWRSRLILEREDPNPAVRWIIKQCIKYLAEDDNRQKQRLEAMRMVHKIIELKLSKAGLLDDDTKGRILLIQRQADMEEGTGAGDPKKSRSNILRLVGKGSDADPEK